jgi:hypothetical protein
VQEVRNYVRALEHGMARLEDLPISTTSPEPSKTHYADGLQ